MIPGPKTVAEFMALPIRKDYRQHIITADNQQDIRERFPDLPSYRIGTAVNERISHNFELVDTAGDTVMMVTAPGQTWILDGDCRRPWP